MCTVFCSRNKCNSPRPKTYIDSTIGWICDECKEEFKLYLDKLQIVATTESDIKNNLEVFMVTRKGDYNEKAEKTMTVDYFFKEHTR